MQRAKIVLQLRQIQAEYVAAFPPPLPSEFRAVPWLGFQEAQILGGKQLRHRPVFIDVKFAILIRQAVDAAGASLAFAKNKRARDECE